jgi:hypothetical protein
MMKCIAATCAEGTKGFFGVPKLGQRRRTLVLSTAHNLICRKGNPMPGLSPVNLSYLAQSKTSAAQALMNLAQFADGPLRLETRVEHGVTVKYLGVRSWSTYFFEKLIATSGEKTAAKLETQKAIDEHVRSFLNNSGITLGYSAEALTADLQSKVVKKCVLPDPVGQLETRGNGKAGTGARNNNADLVETKSRIFRGIGTVPGGLTLAAAPPLKMIADVRLVTGPTFDLHPKTDSTRGQTHRLNDDLPDSGGQASVKKWKKYYLDNLSRFGEVIQTSVVMELQPDSEGDIPEAQRQGAFSAAEEFIRLQKQQGKQVSIMLTVTKLPAVNGSKAALG